ncbi:FAD binding domain-containing protein [Phycomyces nitens]|nr:FAD binding domain-containing protein [Phycomyces nitens]
MYIFIKRIVPNTCINMCTEMCVETSIALFLIMISVDVLVCGAGPVGLFFGYLMATKGHSVYVFDKIDKPSENSRALLVTSRTLDMFSLVGLEAPVIRESRMVRGVQVYSKGERLGTAEASGDTTFPQQTILPQVKLERILQRNLDSKGFQVHWHTTLTAYEQTEDGIKATLDCKGDSIVVQASYLVGADGTHSAVRRLASDWEFKGVSVDTRFALADVTLKGRDVDEELKNRMTSFLNQDGAMMFLPFEPVNPNPDPNNHFRVIVSMGKYEKLANDESNGVTHGIRARDTRALGFDELKQEMKKRLGGLDIHASNPVWLTYFAVNERLVDTYRQKRVFLAGDAAHCHSPLGGQGMNIGLQDADNLAWKMSLVLRNLSNDPDFLLDSYNTERRAVAESIIKSTSQGTQFVFSNHWLISYLRSGLIKIALSIPQIRNIGVQKVQQISMSIPVSPLHGLATPHLIQPGQFIKNTSPLRSRTIGDSLEWASLHSILGNDSRFIVLWVCTCKGWQTPSGLTDEFLKKTRPYSKAVRRIVVSSAWHTRDSQAMGEEWWIEGSWDEMCVTRRVGLDKRLAGTNTAVEAAAGMVVLRPDLYVAQSSLVQTEQDLEEAVGYLAHAFGTIVTHTYPCSPEE